MNTPRRRLLVAIAGFVVWAEAGYLLSGRLHLVLRYDAVAGVQPFDCKLLLLVPIGLALAFGAWCAARPSTADGAAGRPGAALWLVGCAVVPLLEGLRRLGVPVPMTFVEPLFFALASGMAAWLAARHVPWPPRGSDSAGRAPWFWCVVAAAVGCAAWWYYQAHVAYSNYNLGYHDFADFARRVANTSEGRGFLSRSPIWPAFFDHVNPGLLVLVPLWGLWPDAHLFLLVQAVCLSLPALLVYAIARRLGATPSGAAAWGGAYLVFPAVGQINLCFSYGFHAVSMALPLVFAAAWSCFARRPYLALALAILGCTFKENVFVIVAGLALAFAVLELIQRASEGDRPRLASPDPGGSPSHGNAEPRAIAGAAESHLTGLAPGSWLVVSVAFAAAFVFVAYGSGLTGGAGTWRFPHLGKTFGEVLLSPILRPRAFWGEIFQVDSAYYLLALLVPAGLPCVVRGWPILIALVVPVTLLLAWGFDGATSIALQYVTLLIPVVFLAAMIGAIGRLRQHEAAPSNEISWAGLLALTSGTVASFFIGALPFSRTTIPFAPSSEEVAARAPYREVLDRAVETAGGPDAATLASGRLAAHLLGVKRLEMVRHALQRTDALAGEAGPGKPWIEVFDWVALDLNDRAMHHSLAELGTCSRAAESAGYHLVFAKLGVLVYRRPGIDGEWVLDPLARWRVPDEEARELAAREDVRLMAPGVRVAKMTARLVRSPNSMLQQMEVQLVLQAAQDFPPEYGFRHVVRSKDGRILADSGLLVPVGGNRPTSWWKKGEAWAERYALRLPSAMGLNEILHDLEAVPAEHPFD